MLGLEEVIRQNHDAVDAFTKGNNKPLERLFSRNGEAIGFDLVAKQIAPELAFIVEVERLRAKIGGSQEVTPVSLRVTTVFRNENGAWKIVHRHADPITSARPADSVIQA